MPNETEVNSCKESKPNWVLIDHVHGVMIADENGHIIACVDPHNSISLMRPEDFTRASLICRAPSMQAEIAALQRTIDYLDSIK